MTTLTKSEDAGDQHTAAERRAVNRGIVKSEKEYAQGCSFGPFTRHEDFLASLRSRTPKPRIKKTKRRAIKVDFVQRFKQCTAKPAGRPAPPARNTTISAIY